MRIGILCALAVSALLTGAASAAPSLDIYGGLPGMDDVAISPDGSMIAFLTSDPGAPVVKVQRLADRAQVAMIQAGSDKVRALQWADDSHLLITVSDSRFLGWDGDAEFYQTVSFDVLSKRFFSLLKNAHFASHLEAGLPEAHQVGGKTTIYVPGATLSGLSGVLTMFAVDPVTGDATELEAGTKQTDSFAIGADGSVAARVDYDDDKKHWGLLMKQGGHWHELFGLDAGIETPELLGLGPDGKSILVRTLDNGHWTYRAFNVADGAPVAAAGISGDADPLYDPVSRLPVGLVSVDDHYHYSFFDPSDTRAWARVVAAFPGEELHFESWTADHKHIVAMVTGKRDGASYQTVDVDSGAVTRLGDAYTGVSAADLAEVQSVTYHAADGLAIPAFLTLPNGKPAKNLPLIVLPHGGPVARDMPGFDWWAQALASRGYAVLQPQFRGSDGYGWSFLSAGFGEWGRKMQTDLSDGVATLAKQGIVDPKRVCIVGASYGGYAALAGAALQHGIYRCAVSVSGVSDPMNMMSHLSGKGRGERFLERFFGVSDYMDRKLDDIAPLAHSGDVDIPVLMIHGTHDSVVSYTQSQYMNDAMKRDGKPVTIVLLDGGDHWMSTGPARRYTLTKMVEFLEANNPPN